MSEYDELPSHVQEEIMKRLPMKSLVQFRSVSKAWKSLIDSSEFIAAHSRHRHTQQKHLLVSYEVLTEDTYYVSYIDDDTFPQQRSHPTIPLSVNQLINPRVVGSSQGLVCVYGSHPDHTTKMAVLWNPSLRKSIVVAVPGQSDVGFGVCHVTNDPKIISIKLSRNKPHTETSYLCNVMVYSLCSGKWESISNLPTKPLRWLSHAVVSDQFIYWPAKLPTHNMIMSFDVTNEKIEMIDLPDSLARHNVGIYCISQLKESLAIIEYMGDIRTVWMMEHGVQRSFTKLFTIETPHQIVGLTKSGIPLMEVTLEDDYDESKLVIYEPNSQQRNVLESTAPPCPFSLNSYMETLLLLGRSDCTSY